MITTTTIIVSETVIANGVTTTSRVEVTGDLEQVRHLVTTRPGLLAAHRDADQVATRPTANQVNIHQVDAGDVFQAMAGMTTNEANETWRLNNVYLRDRPPAASPMCGPSRAGGLLTGISKAMANMR